MRTIFVATGLLAFAFSTGTQAAPRADEHTAASAKRSAESASAAAREAQQAVDTLRASTAEHCQGESAAAERVMTARQLGAAMSTVMTTATKYGEPYVGFVNTAYAMPRLSTVEEKDVVIDDFRDEAYKRCLERWNF